MRRATTANAIRVKALVFFGPNLIFLSLNSVSEKPNMKYAQQKCANDRALPSTLIWVVRPAGSHQTVLLIAFLIIKLMFNSTFDPETKQAQACETNHLMNFRDPNPLQRQVLPLLNRNLSS